MKKKGRKSKQCRSPGQTDIKKYRTASNTSSSQLQVT